MSCGLHKKEHKNNKIKKYYNNPYRTKPINECQKQIRIPHKLTTWISENIKENINDVYYHMVIINTIQLMQNNIFYNIKIFNYNFHDKITDNILYGVAKKDDCRDYKWRMMDTLYSIEQIYNMWNITVSALPKITEFQLINANKIKSVLLNKIMFKKVINNTNWCKIEIFYRVN
eukprot:185239_1